MLAVKAKSIKRGVTKEGKSRFCCTEENHWCCTDQFNNGHDKSGVKELHAMVECFRCFLLVKTLILNLYINQQWGLVSGCPVLFWNVVLLSFLVTWPPHLCHLPDCPLGFLIISTCSSSPHSYIFSASSLVLRWRGSSCCASQPFFLASCCCLFKLPLSCSLCVLEREVL